MWSKDLDGAGYDRLAWGIAAVYVRGKMLLVDFCFIIQCVLPGCMTDISVYFIFVFLLRCPLLNLIYF